MIIYPKVSIDDFSSEVEEILRKSEGIEHIRKDLTI